MSGIKFKKISHRMFAYLFVGLGFLITFILVFQLVFLERWYYSQVIDNLKDNIVQLEKDIQETDDVGYYILERFMDENNATVNIMSYENYFAYSSYPMVINEDGSINESAVVDSGIDDSYTDDIVMFTVKLEDGGFYYVPVELYQIEEYRDVEIGDVLDIDGYIMDESMIVPVTSVEYYDAPTMKGADVSLISELNDVYQREKIVNATVTEVVNSEAVFYDYGYTYYDKTSEVTIEEGFNYFVVQQPFSDVNTVVFSKDITMSNGEATTIFVESSLQNVDEVLSVMLPFFVAFYVLGLIMVVIMAKVLSDRMTSPILNITSKANRMSELNFEEYIEVESEDELGQLARSINSLSENLSGTMSDLKDANINLLEDITKERRIKAEQKEFVANVSHELKTPIGIAKGYIEAIKDGIRKDKHSQYLEITLQELARMNDTVVNMLQLMKYEDGQKPLDYRETNVTLMLDEIEGYFGVMLEGKAMAIRLPHEVITLRVDRPTFRTLITNILSNAIHYGSNGTDIRVELEKVLLEGHSEPKCQFTIRNKVDKPEGIDLDKIWYKFYTMDQSHNRQLSGTGLGLSIVKSILNQYESEYSAKVDGDEFIFTFTI